MTIKRIYIASKVKHANKWKNLRSVGVKIISTWIDEAGPGDSPDLKDLCKRIIEECLNCDAMIVYSELGEGYLRGAFIEMGIVLGRFGGTAHIYLVGPALPIGSVFTFHPNVHFAESVEQAVELINNDR